MSEFTSYSQYGEDLVLKDLLGTDVVCIKHDNKVKELVDHMKKYEFNYHSYNGCNIIFWKTKL